MDRLTLNFHKLGILCIMMIIGYTLGPVRLHKHLGFRQNFLFWVGKRGDEIIFLYEHDCLCEVGYEL